MALSGAVPFFPQSIRNLHKIIDYSGQETKFDKDTEIYRVLILDCNFVLLSQLPPNRDPSFHSNPHTSIKPLKSSQLLQLLPEY